MVRTVSMLVLAALLMTAVAGCRHHPCGLTSSSGSRSPCRLIGSGRVEECHDPATGYPLTGIPVSGPEYEVPGTLVPGNGVPVLPAPGGVGGPRPDELPYPRPDGLIPPVGVPIAPPTPAPGFPNAGASKIGNGQPVKYGK